MDSVLARVAAKVAKAKVDRAMNAAITVFRNAVDWKTREYGENSLQVAESLHDLGELLLEEERPDEAVEPLQRALNIRAASAALPDDDENEAGQAVRSDTAITRFLIGRLYEQRGDYKAAREIRRAGRDLGQVVCDYKEVTARPQLCCRQLLIS